MEGKTRTISGGCMTVTFGLENTKVNISYGQICEVGYELVYLLDSDGNYLMTSNNEYLTVKDEGIQA